MSVVPAAPFDHIKLELYRHRFSGIAEEMGEALRRTGFSPNIKERLDFSCALFDGEGRIIAQAAHIPVHLGAMPASVAAAREAVSEWRQGDCVILNDPFRGGTHLPDITLVSPVFCGGDLPDFFVANRAHHADVGGMSPGSLPLSREIYQEGFIIPPLKLMEAGQRNEAIFTLLCANTRTPDERRGDLEAQLAAQFLGAERLLDVVNGNAQDEVLQYAAHLRQWSETRARQVIAGWPNGTYQAHDFLEIEGHEAKICVTVRIEDDGITFDFHGTSPALPFSLNAVESIAFSACYYVVACSLGDIPLNAGTFAPIQVTIPHGCLINATSPRAVAGGNVETSQLITDVVLRALSQALPDQIPASSQGTMNNLTIGGEGFNNLPFAYYETLGGGAGASPSANGASALQVHMTNTLNTPIEALERAFPLRVTQYQIRPQSGGAGEHQGGNGLIREYEFLRPATVTMLSERRQLAPPGIHGGADGAIGRNTLVSGGNETQLPSKFTRQFQIGERLRIETPGGGGFGPATEKGRHEG